MKATELPKTTYAESILEKIYNPNFNIYRKNTGKRHFLDVNGQLMPAKNSLNLTSFIK